MGRSHSDGFRRSVPWHRKKLKILFKNVVYRLLFCSRRLPTSFTDFFCFVPASLPTSFFRCEKKSARAGFFYRLLFSSRKEVGSCRLPLPTSFSSLGKEVVSCRLRLPTSFSSLGKEVGSCRLLLPTSFSS